MALRDGKSKEILFWRAGLEGGAVRHRQRVGIASVPAFAWFRRF